MAKCCDKGCRCGKGCISKQHRCTKTPTTCRKNCKKTASKSTASSSCGCSRCGATGNGCQCGAGWITRTKTCHKTPTNCPMTASSCASTTAGGVPPAIQYPQSQSTISGISGETCTLGRDGNCIEGSTGSMTVTP